MIPPGAIQRANFVLDKDDILDVSNSIQILKRNLSTVQLSITKVQKDLDDQLQAIALTRQRLEEAKANEESILEAISRGEALLAPSPIRRLPAEILSEIFLHFLNRCFAETSLGRPRILKAQTLLRVSRRWRQTIMSEPRFWRTIPVGYFEGYRLRDRPPFTAEHWEKLKERIARAGDAQNLRILVMIDVKDNVSQSRIIQTVSDLLPRAKTFQMEANCPLIDGETIPRPVETISKLKEVVLESMDKSYGTWIHNILARASLRTLKCYSLSPQFIPSSCLGKLRCLRLNGCVESGEVFRAMADAPLLAELYIRDIRRTQGQTHTAKIVIRHEQLETLHVDSAEFDLLESLTLPRLRHLFFGRAIESVTSDCGTSHLSTVEWPSGSKFFERSNCKLLSLEVVDVRVSPDLVDILQSQKSLKTLYFRSRFGRSAPRAILDFLEANLPFLRRLRICVEPSEIPAVQRILTERTKRTKRGKFVALKSCSIVVVARGCATETMKESHRKILRPFLKGSKVVRLVYH